MPCAPANGSHDCCEQVNANQLQYGLPTSKEWDKPSSVIGTLGIAPPAVQNVVVAVLIATDLRQHRPPPELYKVNLCLLI